MSLAVSLTKISVIYENMLQRSGCKEKMFAMKRTEPVGRDTPQVSTLSGYKLQLREGIAESNLFY
jgi:hypothetical protein